MRHHKFVSTLIAGAMLTVPTGAAADTRTFEVRKDGGSRVTFKSDAMLETINGVSSKLHGSLKLDPEDLSDVEGELKVPVKSIDTGIELRDKHLRSKKWLNAERWPHIEFDIKSVSGASRLPENEAKRLRIRGKLSIHGVTKTVTAKARVKYIPLTEKMKKTPGINGDVLRGRAQIDLKLSDYNIDIPTAVRLKVSNEITINVNLRGIAQNQ